MKKIYKAISFLAIALLVNAFACDEDPKPDCGCDGRIIEIVENEPAAYRGNGVFIVPSLRFVNQAITFACEADSSWQISAAPDSNNYIISGKLKKRCPLTEDAYSSHLPSWPIEITKAQRQ